VLPSGGKTRVDDFTGAVIGDLGAGLGADADVRALDGLDDLDEEIRSEERTSGEALGTVPERIVV
jgi:hypothetical protein